MYQHQLVLTKILIEAMMHGSTNVHFATPFSLRNYKNLENLDVKIQKSTQI